MTYSAGSTPWLLLPKCGLEGGTEGSVGYIIMMHAEGFSVEECRAGIAEAAFVQLSAYCRAIRRF
ncbi:hypothetical protein MFRU_005g04630 [Monilinia fructicola]|nr:hypothetical protein MFRU_005g04630 [Monilinia fructicola]